MDGGNGMPGGMLPTGMGSGGLLGLDMSLHPHQQMHQQQSTSHSQQQQQQPLLHHQLRQTHHLLPFQAPTANDGEHQAQHPIRHAQYAPPFGPVRGKQQPAMSSEEEPGYREEVDDQARRGGVSQPAPSASPWQRMKWTDSMVRLLIQVVYRVGDDGGGAAEGEQQQPHGSVAKGKKSAAAASASALLQKKGKWKSVSRAMMEKGFFVSPQQCEDKFNDLNKRYKRVNDLLGRGTACRVVENQAILDTMDLSPKAKEEARKLLNSKHLFFREMCAYHNAGGSSSCAPPQIPPPPPSDQQQQQLCFHHPPGRADTAASTGKAAGGFRGGAAAAAAEEEGMAEDVDDDDDVDSEDEDDYDEEEDEDDDEEEDHNHKRHGHCHHHHHPQHKHEEGEEDEDSKGFAAGCAGAKKHKRTASQMSASPPLSLTLSSPSGSMQQLRSELVAMSGGGEQQRRQWLKRKAAELEEQRVAYQSRAFQLERQRFKWLRFSTNKEREMERMKLDNERLRLENDRMLLMLRQKELELIHGGSVGVSAAISSADQKRPAEQPHMSNADHPSTAA